MPKPSHVLTLPTLHPHAAELRDAILDKLTYSCSKTPSNAGPYDWYLATVLAVRDRIVDRWMESERATERKHGKRVYYLSLEFLIGRLLCDALSNLRLLATARAALASLDVDLDELRKLEPDAALGNGGLGRLAACFMDSMATLGVAGLRLRHPLRARPVQAGDPRRLAGRAAGATGWPSAIRGSSSGREAAYPIRLRRQRRDVGGDRGRHGARSVEAGRAGAAVAYDTPIVGWRGRARQHAAAVVGARDRRRSHLDAFNRGDYVGALRRATPGRGDHARALSRATRRRPARSCACGRSISSPRPRCRTSSGAICSSHDDLDIAARPGRDPAQRHASGDRRRRADAHPGRRARHGLGRRLAHHHATLISYTNHTLLPEALESWPVPLFERLLPRHMQIIYEINALHPRRARASGRRRRRELWPRSRSSTRAGRRVRMGHLAFVGSHKVNGVSALHTELMKKTVFRDLDRLYPEPDHQQDQRHHAAPLAARRPIPA